MLKAKNDAKPVLYEGGISRTTLSSKHVKRKRKNERGKQLNNLKMTKEQFFKENDEKFLAIGFVKDELDPMFYYKKTLASEDAIEENDLDEDSVPSLLFGNTGINRGFCIYTGEHFVWLDCATPEEADVISKHIVAFEPV